MIYFKIIFKAVLVLTAWALFVAFSTLEGWWHSPMVSDNSPQVFMNAVRDVVSTRNVGNVALVLIEGGEIHEEYFDSASQKIDRDTVFPTASMSKWITALGVMTLVQNGIVDIDEPISNYLTRWQLPSSEFDLDGVTVRRLLSHMAGLSDGLGFGDYEPGESIPALEDSLSNPRASSGNKVRIALGRTPGTKWDYSGGGYLILQLIVEEVTGQSFEDYMQSAILQPLGMIRSTFEYIGNIENKTISYDAKGRPAVLYQYAASAATGFSSSIADMTRLVQALISSDKSSQPLLRSTLEQMRKPQAQMFGVDIWGLGTILYSPVEPADFIYGHDGQNDPALNTAVRINPGTGDAIIVFASGNASLATFLGFEWVFWQTGLPDFLGIGYVIQRGLHVFAAGAFLILAFTVIAIWRFRRKYFL